MPRRPSRPRAARTAALVGGLALAASTLPSIPAAADGHLPTLTPVAGVTLVDEGDQALVTVELATADGEPLAEDLEVAWTTGDGTAVADLDYRAAAGTVTFPAGSPDGTRRTVAVTALRDTRPREVAKSVPVTFSTADATVAGGATVVVNAEGFPYLDASLPVERRVADLLSRMTLAEKVGQMTQAERGNVTGDPTLVTSLGLGSVLSGGGSVPAENTPEGWADMVDRFQSHALATRLQVPLVYGVDAVHGHGNLLGATVFPHNVGLGATRDVELVTRAAHVTAVETRATGIPWNFAPCLCVARDDRWGRTYEVFGEDPGLVSRMAAVIEGYQGEDASGLDQRDRVLATAKHFAGDGQTLYGSAEGDYQIDQGVTVTSREDFARLSVAPFWPAVQEHAVGSVMPSFSSVDWTEDGVGNPIKMHANEQLLTGLLKERMGFDGFVVSDWEAIHQIPGDWPTQVRTSVNAGVDMFMEPAQFSSFAETLIAEVQARRVPGKRIDDAVTRILTKKFELGLFEQPFADRTNLGTIGSDEHRAVARQAVAQSQTLLRNEGDVLPLAKDASIYLAGRSADDTGNQSGGWTLTWQGGSGTNRVPGTSVREGIAQVAPDAQVTFSADASAPVEGHDVGVVVVGETPYSEGFGDVGGPEWAYDPDDAGVPREEKSMSLQPEDKAVIDTVCSAVEECVVLVVSGRPQVVTDQLGSIDALVASWLPGSEGAGVADVLFGDQPFSGRLPLTWPVDADQQLNVGDDDYYPLYPYGWGLTTGDGARAAASPAALRTALEGAGDAAAADAVVEQARVLAQRSVTAAGDAAPRDWAATFARAEQDRLAGRTGEALDALIGLTGGR